MDLQHAKILLEKINALYQSIAADENRVSGIERDLMLSYIRQLYDAFLDIEQLEPRPTKKEPAQSSYRPELEIVEPEEPKSKPQPRPKPKKPRIIEIPDSLKDIEEKQISKKEKKEPTPPPRPEPEPQPKPSPEPTYTAPPEPEPSTEVSHDPAFEDLFEHKTARELSEKLSERPIYDLSKAISINDRLLYVNQLFGKSMDALNIALNHLNTLDGMTDAKPYLIKLAGQHDWLDQDKQDTAKDFIKLVRRRYQG